MSTIDSEKQLLKKLKIDSLEKLKDEKVQKRFIRIKPRISPELLKQILSVVPELTAAFTEIIKSMRDIGSSLETTKRQRWEVLKTVAESGKLTGDQILEAMRIIQEIEKNEHIDWNKVFDKTLDALKVGGAVVLFVVIFLLSAGGGNRKK